MTPVECLLTHFESAEDVADTFLDFASGCIRHLAIVVTTPHDAAWGAFARQIARELQTVRDTFGLRHSERKGSLKREGSCAFADVAGVAEAHDFANAHTPAHPSVTVTTNPEAAEVLLSALAKADAEADDNDCSGGHALIHVGQMCAGPYLLAPSAGASGFLPPNIDTLLQLERASSP